MGPQNRGQVVVVSLGLTVLRYKVRNYKVTKWTGGSKSYDFVKYFEPRKLGVRIKRSIRNGFLLDIKEYLLSKKWIFARYEIKISLIKNFFLLYNFLYFCSV